MNILLLSDSFLPHAGGSRVYYYNVYRRLAEQCGNHVTILTKKVPGWEAFDARVQASNFRIIRHLKPAGDWKYHQVDKLLFPFLKAVATVRKTQPDIIHVGDLFPQGPMALALKRIFGLPYVVYCHGEEITQMDRARFEPRMRDLIYQNAARVIAASAFARQNLQRIGIADSQVTKITPGVDFGRFESKTGADRVRQKFLFADRLVILTVARLVPRKGHADMIKAIAQLRRTTTGFHYLIVGTGPEEAGLRELTRALGVENCVTFGGYVPDAELPGYYAACDILAMPNFEDAASGDIEGFGMVFLEANAAGKPVLGGRSGGTEEAILDGVTGFLCKPRNVSHIAALLEALLRHPELRQAMGASGRARVRDDFKWESRADAVHAISDHVLSQCRSCETEHSSGGVAA